MISGIINKNINFNNSFLDKDHDNDFLLKDKLMIKKDYVKDENLKIVFFEKIYDDDHDKKILNGISDLLKSSSYNYLYSTHIKYEEQKKVNEGRFRILIDTNMLSDFNMNFFSDYILSTKDKKFFLISWSGGNIICSNEKNLMKLVSKLDYRNSKEILEQYLLFII